MSLYGAQHGSNSNLMGGVSAAHGSYLPLAASGRFGARLRVLRKERQMTQQRMATDFGIDQTLISEVERGQRSISLGMLEMLAAGLEVSLSDLLADL